MKLFTKTTLILTALTALGNFGFAQVVAPTTQTSGLSEREAQMIYSRAFEATLWASPAVAIIAQIEAGRRDLGANYL